METQQQEILVETGKKSILRAFFWPFLFSAVMWLVKIFESLLEIKFIIFGVYPRTAQGLIGIITSPFIHGDYLHLLSNTIPIILLGAALVYFYKSIALRVFLLIFFLTGIWVWLAGRPSYHIGASGVVYGLAFFLFLSGIFRKDRSLMAFSLLVVFLYGGIIWGILPIDTGMSWEGHLFGALSGIICAIAFRNEGPQRKKYEWEYEEEDNEDEDENPENKLPPDPLQVNYTITKKDTPSQNN